MASMTVLDVCGPAIDDRGESHQTVQTNGAISFPMMPSSQNGGEEGEDDVDSIIDDCSSLGSLLDLDDDAADELAQDLKELHVRDERVAAENDLHGVAKPIHETEDMVEDSIERMNASILSDIPAEDKKAYLTALSKSPEYVTSRKMSLLFLRAARFDPEWAAERIVRHFHEKETLFGRDLLCRDIVLSDLNAGEVHMLESGHRQLFPIPDSAGRSVVTMFATEGALRNFQAVYGGNITSMQRSTWYFFMTVLKQENAQINGVVVVVYNEISRQRIARLARIANRNKRIREAVPIRVVGIHHCSQTYRTPPYVLRDEMMPSMLLRTRLHQGTKEEAEEFLRAFGIPTQVIPCLSKVQDSLVYHLDWIHRQRTSEEIEKRKLDESTVSRSDSDSPSVETIVTAPSRLDVLAGRGKSRDHPGNCRLRHFVQTYQEKYEAADRNGKTTIALLLISMVHKSGGRFLRRDGGWVEMDMLEAREKVSKLFRRNRRSVKST